MLSNHSLNWCICTIKRVTFITSRNQQLPVMGTSDLECMPVQVSRDITLFGDVSTPSFGHNGPERPSLGTCPEESNQSS